MSDVGNPLPPPATPVTPVTRHIDMSAMLRLMQPLDGWQGNAESQRKLLASLCRFVGQQVGCDAGNGLRNTASRLSPRQRQTLAHLLNGDSEKQIAAKLALSRHTVHVYVKELYRHFGASSRAELLARWVKTD